MGHTKQIILISTLLTGLMAHAQQQRNVVFAESEDPLILGLQKSSLEIRPGQPLRIVVPGMGELEVGIRILPPLTLSVPALVTKTTCYPPPKPIKCMRTSSGLPYDIDFIWAESLDRKKIGKVEPRLKRRDDGGFLNFEMWDRSREEHYGQLIPDFKATTRLTCNDYKWFPPIRKKNGKDLVVFDRVLGEDGDGYNDHLMENQTRLTTGYEMTLERQKDGSFSYLSSQTPKSEQMGSSTNQDRELKIFQDAKGRTCEAVTGSDLNAIGPLIAKMTKHGKDYASKPLRLIKLESLQHGVVQSELASRDETALKVADELRSEGVLALILLDRVRVYFTESIQQPNGSHQNIYKLRLSGDPE